MLSIIMNRRSKTKRRNVRLKSKLCKHRYSPILFIIRWLAWNFDLAEKNRWSSSRNRQFHYFTKKYDWEKEEVIPVKEEIKSVQSYIDLLSMRYGERISAKIMIPDELQSLSMPNMILQPIIENAYLHAFHNKTQGFITVYGKTKISFFYSKWLITAMASILKIPNKNDHFQESASAM